jgi:hypothetical protein
MDVEVPVFSEFRGDFVLLITECHIDDHGSHVARNGM